MWSWTQELWILFPQFPDLLCCSEIYFISARGTEDRRQNTGFSQGGKTLTRNSYIKLGCNLSIRVNEREGDGTEGTGS